MSFKGLDKKLFPATKVSELVAIINELMDDEAIAWRPVGGNDNNLAIIGIGSDPAAGLIERITNAIDSILDQMWIGQKSPQNISSPRMATEKWFDVKDGRLTGYKTGDLKKLDKIANLVKVSLRDSDRTDKPTIDIRDFGTGLSSEEFADTILSLNKNRKLKKLFLAGAFGQGGSSALAHSQFTVICSRKSATVDGKKFPVGVTIVRFNPGDSTVDKHGVYEFMVDRKTGCPITLDVSEDDFPHGTLVRHVVMELGKYNAVMTAPTGSLWYLTHNYLFDPILPFRISEERSTKENNIRMVTGNHRRLTDGEFTEYTENATLTFRDGSVNIRWWVLTADGENSKGRISNYVMPSAPIVVTYNGQKQGTFPNTVIKDDLKLPYLDRYIVVHVDCDKLDADSRRQLFPTTREALRDTPIGDDLRRLVLDTLAGDPDLRRLDHERKQRYVKQEDQQAVDAIRKRLARRVKTATASAGDGKGPTTNPNPPNADSTPKKREPIPVQDPPTFLRISSAAPRKIYPGRSFTLNFETDARSEYFANAENFIAVINPPSMAQFTGTTSVRDGYGVAYFKAEVGADIGSIAKITLELRPPKHTSLADSIDVVLADLPATSGGAQGESSAPNINPIWVTQSDPFWKDSNWNKASVAQVNRSDDGVDIFISADNDKLSSLIARAQRRDIQAVDNVKNFYLEHIAFYAMLQDIERNTKSSDAGEGDSKPSSEDDVKFVSDTGLRHACETVCGIVEGIFEVIANAPPET